MDLIRLIALEIAEFEWPAIGDDSMLNCSEGLENEVFSGHLDLMLEAGLIHAQRSDSMGMDPPAFHKISLTWDGQEFVDQVRSETAWSAAKDYKGKVGSYTLPIIQGFLTNWATGKFSS